MQLPKVYVGTLYCGENDFDSCVESIISQKSVQVTHHIIKNENEQEAHNKLWDSWNKVKNEHDFFVKVDADTVLAHDFVLENFWSMLSSNSRITGIQAPLHDYFTNSHINGLNCFRNNVIFMNSTDSLYCDRNVDTGHDIVIKSNDVIDELKPAGYHCHNANAKQAFHYGVHRTLKKQVATMNLVKATWKIYKDDIRAYALLGSMYAKKFTKENHSYSTQMFNDAFQECESNFETLKLSL